MKTKEELDALREEVESLHEKLAELTDEELEQVTGGEFGGPGTVEGIPAPEPTEKFRCNKCGEEKLVTHSRAHSVEGSACTCGGTFSLVTH